MNKVKVLYVEDELFLGKIVRESLESRGFEVIMETDGSKVLSVFKKSPVDICVLDIMLPNQDGFEIASALREIDRKVPILFVTAKTQTQDVVRGFTIGANDYIRKPFSMEELIVRIHYALKIKQEEASKITADPVTIGKYVFQINRQMLAGAQERRLSFR